MLCHVNSGNPTETAMADFPVSLTDDSSGRSPSLDEPTRDLVRRSLASGLVKIEDVKKVVVSLLTQTESLNPQRLVDGLIGAGVLTQWQGRKLLAGAAKGFYLGNYRLLRPLGRGGMGVVYLGQHHVMKREMALKILPTAAAQDKRRIDRFKAEAEACAQLDHENIVRAYDFGSAGGKLYIVMEYVDGIDLGAAVARDGVMSPAAAIDVLTQATEGLAHAHSRGIVHRDIKPSNLLLRSDGVVKVSDLGLARIGVGQASTDGKTRMLGTADYLAPEQAINSQTVDSRADIYSLGCTLVYLVSGKPPYKAASVPEVLAKHQTSPIVDLAKICPQCPPGLVELARRMMAKQPADRPRSAVELLVQLKRLGGRSTASESLPRGYQTPSSETMIDDGGSLTGAGLGESGSSIGSNPGFGSNSDIGSNSGFGPGDGIDFENLPAIDLSSTPSLGVAAVSKPAAGALSGSTGHTKPAHSKPVAAASGEKQTIMLGIGLTLAVLALMFVFVIAYRQLTGPLPGPPTKLKSVEDGKGNVIIVSQ